MVERLLLWDVDGTLVRTGDVGAEVFHTAIEKVLGAEPAERISMSGKTDPQIVLEYLEEMGVVATDDVVDAILGHLATDLAVAASAGEIRRRGWACPGVAELLEEVAGDNRVVSTLLTGNIYPNAIVKVAAFGLDQWLRTDMGAYGSDDRDRDRLVPIALARLAEVEGARVDPSDVWVIGDTPRDYQCATVAGARCLLVGTGRYPVEELDRIGAEAVLDDLADTASALKLLTGDLG